MNAAYLVVRQVMARQRLTWLDLATRAEVSIWGLRKRLLRPRMAPEKLEWLARLLGVSTAWLACEIAREQEEWKSGSGGA